MQWNLHSNVCDTLGLGPRMAGLLARVGIQTVADLLAATPQSVGRRLRDSCLTADGITACVITAWQCESRLVLEMPGLPATAARLLATVGIEQVKQIARFTPIELLAAIESSRLKNPESWLAGVALPAVAEVGDWIDLAQTSEKFRAA